jgi:glycerophosphoryl diester phosphodiesterase
MLKLIKNSFDDLKQTFKQLMLFEFLYLLLTSFIFVPTISYIFHRVLWSIGSGTLLNTEVFKIVLNYKGLLGLIVITIVAVIVLFIQFGVIIVITQKQYFNKHVTIMEALVSVIKNIPKIFTFSIFQLGLLFICLIPFIDSPLLSSLTGDIDLEVFIRHKILESELLFMLYILVLLIVIYILLRWIFTLHYMILEDKSTKDAIKESMRLTKANSIKILIGLFVLNGLILYLALNIISFITFIPALIQGDINNFILENFLVTLSSFLTYLLTLLLIPINITFITRLYYQFSINQGVVIKDRWMRTKSKKIKKIESKIEFTFYKRKYFWAAILTVMFLVTFLINYSMNEDIAYLGRSISIASHRGDMYSAPENSMSGIRSALKKEVDFIEIDIQMTKDGKIVLFHDTDLRRIVGVSDKIIDLPYEEVLKYEIGSYFSEVYFGEKIPTLEAVLEEVKGKANLLIDVKPYGSRVKMAETLVDLIEQYEMVESSYVQSFDYGILSEIRNLNKEIKIGQLMYVATGRLASLDVDFYSIEQSMLSNRIVSNARQLNREVWVWTLNKERNIKDVLKYDIDGIITGFPELAQSIIGLR